ncbi:MAG: GNAT family N-acetyltransferase [Gemmatimonadota bacterium]|nr:GNAT family N-acetyltransferase [Gemmatimonadota bacterium]
MDQKDLPVGAPLPDWKPRARPGRQELAGRYCRLEPLAAERHAADLFEAYAGDTAGVGWTYLPYGPFKTVEAFGSWLSEVSSKDEPLFFAILDGGGTVVGVASYLRINPEMGSIEVGHIHYSPQLQRTLEATEAMYLMARRAFDELGYRRYEWKCDDLNAASRRAADRLGFVYEGTFRQDRIYKGRNRDTAWYSITDGEWPAVRAAFEAWLEPANFDANGQQLTRLSTPK